jgi:Tat protein translocase TatB subunit
MESFFLFLNMSGGEILLIIIVAYLVLGPKKIPEVARMIGKGINDLRRATDDIKSEFTKEMNNFKKDVNVNLKDPFIPDAYKRGSSPSQEASPIREEKKENPGTEPELK